MNNQVKIAAIIGIAIVIAIVIFVYFSPYQTCVRATTADYVQGDSDRGDAVDVAKSKIAAQERCAHNSS